MPNGSDVGTPAGNRSVMIVLSYLWILALVPLLVEKEDTEVQWHAKHGLVLLAAELVFWIAFSPDFRFGYGTFIHPSSRHASICAGSA